MCFQLTIIITLLPTTLSSKITLRDINFLTAEKCYNFHLRQNDIAATE